MLHRWLYLKRKKILKRLRWRSADSNAASDFRFFSFFLYLDRSYFVNSIFTRCSQFPIFCHAFFSFFFSPYISDSCEFNVHSVLTISDLVPRFFSFFFSPDISDSCEFNVHSVLTISDLVPRFFSFFFSPDISDSCELNIHSVLTISDLVPRFLSFFFSPDISDSCKFSVHSVLFFLFFFFSFFFFLFLFRYIGLLWIQCSLGAHYFRSCATLTFLSFLFTLCSILPALYQVFFSKITSSVVFMQTSLAYQFLLSRGKDLPKSCGLCTELQYLSEEVLTPVLLLRSLSDYN